MVKQFIEFVNGALDLLMKALPLILILAIIGVVALGYGYAVPFELDLKNLVNLLLLGYLGEPVIKVMKEIIGKVLGLI